jgi:predicted RNase H-like nuclease
MEARLPAGANPSPHRSGLVAGVDGCRGGWVVARADAIDGTVVDVERIEHLRAIVDDVRRGRLDAVALDMPIGLPHSGRRSADTAARALLGPRRSSVFPAPVRGVLDAGSYEEALARSRAVDGRGLSTQTWNLVPKIREVDECITPDLQHQIREAHPELVFVHLTGSPCAWPKRTAEGRGMRIAMLERWWPGPWNLSGAAIDDVIDSVALTVTARRIAAGDATSLGDGAREETGLRMEVVW